MHVLNFDCRQQYNNIWQTWITNCWLKERQMDEHKSATVLDHWTCGAYNPPLTIVEYIGQASVALGFGRHIDGRGLWCARDITILLLLLYTLVTEVQNVCKNEGTFFYYISKMNLSNKMVRRGDISTWKMTMNDEIKKCFYKNECLSC